MALAKYRTFIGGGEFVTWNLGNLSGVSSSPQTMVAVVRLRSGAADTELMYAPGSDPMDWYYSSGTINYWDGAFDTAGPSWTGGTATTDWRLWAFRSRPSLAALWSQSQYNGTSWTTPTHTSSTGTATRSFPTSGQMVMGGTPTTNVDIVCIARFNTALSDAQINAMTAGVAAIQATAGITNLWMVGQTTPADLVGTSTLNTLTGTTLSSTDSPFEGIGGATSYALSATGTGTTTGSLAVGGPTTLKSTGTGTSTGSLAVVKQRPLTATGTGTSTGTLAVTITVGAVSYTLTATGTGTTTGSLAVGGPTTLAATGTGTTTGSLAVTAPMTAAGTGTGTTAGSLAVVALRSLTTTGAGTSTGTLAVTITSGPALLTLASTGHGNSGGHLAVTGSGPGGGGGGTLTSGRAPGGYQPRNTPAERRAFFDHKRQLAKLAARIEVLEP